MGRILDRYFQRAALRRWQRMAQQAADAPHSLLRMQRDHARGLRAHLDRVIHVADARLTLPLIGSRQFPKPVGTDWSWRPDLWRGPLSHPGVASAPRKAALDPQVTVFHDCPNAENAFRQIRNRKNTDLAPYGLSIEVFSFEGSFLSVSVELPIGMARDLTLQHMVQIGSLIVSDEPTHVYARLNIRHGPNTEQVLRELATSSEPVTMGFDLAHLHINERRIDKIWLDLIFESPRMNRMVVRDLTFCRHHRADL